MQYSDPASATRPSREALSEPEPLRKDLPDGLRSTRLIIACTLDRSGELKDARVLEPGAAETTSRVLVALRSWKFRPAFRGNDPVEVTAIIGFGIDTR
jgi:outer membrane biosynthesis protein TonB